MKLFKLKVFLLTLSIMTHFDWCIWALATSMNEMGGQFISLAQRTNHHRPR